MGPSEWFEILTFQLLDLRLKHLLISSAHVSFFSIVTVSVFVFSFSLSSSHPPASFLHPLPFFPPSRSSLQFLHSAERGVSNPEPRTLYQELGTHSATELLPSLHVASFYSGWASSPQSKFVPGGRKCT